MDYNYNFLVPTLPLNIDPLESIKKHWKAEELKAKYKTYTFEIRTTRVKSSEKTDTIIPLTISNSKYVSVQRDIIYCRQRRSTRSSRDRVSIGGLDQFCGRAAICRIAPRARPSSRSFDALGKKSLVNWDQDVTSGAPRTYRDTGTVGSRYTVSHR